MPVRGGRNGEGTPLQKAFVAEYLKNGRNAQQAYLTVRGPMPNRTERGIQESVKKMINTVWVTQQLDVAEERALVGVKRAMARYEITAERITEELAKIAFSDVRDVVDWGPDGVKVKPSSEISEAAAAAVQDVSEQKGLAGSTIRVKNYDKQRALVDLGKAIGMFKEEEKKPTVAVQFNINKD